MVCPGFIVTDLNRRDANKKTIAEKKSVLPIDSMLESLVSFIVLCLGKKQIVLAVGFLIWIQEF